MSQQDPTFQPAGPDPAQHAWERVMQSALKLQWPLQGENGVPFGILHLSNEHGPQQAAREQWSARRLERIGENRWLLGTEREDGLHARCHIECYPDTRAVEYWGTLTNNGTRAIKSIVGVSALNIEIGSYAAGLGEAWVRTINGVSHQPPGCFPPYDFQPVDRQVALAPGSRSWGSRALFIDSGPNGWASEGHLPCALIADHSRTSGLGVFLEWSGMWYMSFQVGHTPEGGVGGFTIRAGLHGLELDLQPGETLPVPRALLLAFAGDLEAGGNAMRCHIRQHVSPKLSGDAIVPPTSFNHYFGLHGSNVTSRILRPAIDICGELGIEYFCVDAGWSLGGFRQGIGNWEEDRSKFPEGLAELAKYIRSKGMQYGSWFELEWAHESSPLYREHPDWFWRTPAASPFGRAVTQYYYSCAYHLLNLGNEEAREWCLRRLVRAYAEWGLRWLRYDSNQIPRPNWEHEVCAGETGWRQIQHVTGFYRLMDDLRAACGDLLIEQTSSGGHRIDLGTVRRGHTFWMNDHTHQTDIVRGLQHGLNTILPGNYPNTNLCQPRLDYDDYDLLSHGAGPLGMSLPLHEATRPQLAALRKALDRFKGYRPALLGDYYRPAGCPASADAFTAVEFAGDGRQVAIELNWKRRRGARCRVSAKTA
jgi:hypothetical protein